MCDRFHVRLCRPRLGIILALIVSLTFGGQLTLFSSQLRADEPGPRPVVGNDPAPQSLERIRALMEKLSGAKVQYSARTNDLAAFNVANPKKANGISTLISVHIYRPEQLTDGTLATAKQQSNELHERAGSQTVSLGNGIQARIFPTQREAAGDFFTPQPVGFKVHGGFYNGRVFVGVVETRWSKDDEQDKAVLTKLDADTRTAVIDLLRRMAHGAIDDDDGYWKWLLAFNHLRDDNLARVDGLKVRLKNLRSDHEANQRRWISLLHLEMQVFEAQRDLVDAGVNNGGPKRFRLDQLRQYRQDLAATIAATHDDQKKLIDEGIDLHRQLVDSAKKQAERSRNLRPKLRMTVDQFQDKLATGAVALYDAAGWHGTPEMDRAIAACDFTGDGSQEVNSLMRAVSARARADALDRKAAYQAWTQFSSSNENPDSKQAVEAAGARVEAIKFYREVLALNPRNSEARTALQEMELQFVTQIAAKLQREKKMNYAAFRAYFEKRGYGASDPDKDPQTSWEGFKELSSVFFGSGPITLMAGIGGGNAPAAIADEVDITQMAIAKNQTSLLLIRKLVRTGLSIAQVRALKPDELGEKLDFKSATRQPIDSKHVRELWRDMHESFAELADLRALADGNAAGFMKYHPRSYYAPIESDKCWGEAIGDCFFSPSGLLTWFGPSAITRVSGKWAWGGPWGKMTTGIVAALDEVGEIERGRDLVAGMLKLEEVGNALSKTRAGKALQTAILEDQKYLASLYHGTTRTEKVLAFTRWLTNSSARFAATLVLYGGAGELAEQSGIPGLKQMVDAIACLGFEEMAYDVLSRTGTPLRKVLAGTERLAAHIKAEQELLAHQRKMLERVKTIVDSIKPEAEGGGLSAKAKKELEEITATVSATPKTVSAPGENKSDDVRQSLLDAINAAKNNKPAEAKDALTAAENLADEVKNTLDGWEIKTKEVREFILKNPQARVASPNAKFERINAYRPPATLAPEGGYPAAPHGACLRDGDQALRRGEYTDAENFYTMANHKATESASLAATEEEKAAVDRFKQFAEERIALVRDARMARVGIERNLRSIERNLDIARPIDPKEIKALQEQFASKAVKFGDQPLGGTNPVYVIEKTEGINRNLWAFKVINNEEEIAAELLSAAAIERVLAANPKLRLKAPAVARARISGQMLENADKKLVEADGLLYRFLGYGTRLDEMREPKLLALKDQIAEQRVLRIWLGDWDAHFKNQLLGMDDRLVAIDFGQAHLTEELFHRTLVPFRVLGRNANDQKDLMLAVQGYPKWLFEHHQSKPGLYGWPARIDETIPFEEMSEMLKAIQTICQDGGKWVRADGDGVSLVNALEQTRLPADQQGAALKVLVERARWLKEVLEKCYPPLGPVR